MKNRCTILSIPVFLHRVTAWKRVMPDKILRDGNLRSLWSKQTKHEENDETCAIFIAITPPWFRAVNIARQGWRRWKFHGATLTLGHAYFRESLNKIAWQVLHYAPTRHKAVTSKLHFTIVSFSSPFRWTGNAQHRFIESFWRTAFTRSESRNILFSIFYELCMPINVEITTSFKLSQHFQSASVFLRILHER